MKSYKLSLVIFLLSVGLVSADGLIDNAAQLYVPLGDTYSLSGTHSYTDSVIIEGTLNIDPCTTGDTGTLVLICPDINISGQINGKGCGYPTGEGPGAGSYPGGGGAYGGNGGASGWGNAGGTAYGTAGGVDIQMGSAGASQNFGVGGPGGAAVRLVAETLTISGSITVDGNQGADQLGSWDGGGGGAGGGILVKTANATISGTLSAKGLRGGNSEGRKGGGGGGGGRIKIFYCGILNKTGASFLLTGGAGGTGLSGSGVAGESGTYHEEHGHTLVYKLTMSGTGAEADSNGWVLGKSSGSSYLVLSMTEKDANVLNYVRRIDCYIENRNKLYEISSGSEDFTQSILPGRPPKGKNIASMNLDFDANVTGLLLGTVVSTDIGTLDANDRKTKADIATSLKGCIKWTGNEDDNDIGYGILSAKLDLKWTKTANDPNEAKGFGGNIISFLDPNSANPQGIINWLESKGYKLP